MSKVLKTVYDKGYSPASKKSNQNYKYENKFRKANYKMPKKKLTSQIQITKSVLQVVHTGNFNTMSVSCSADSNNLSDFWLIFVYTAGKVQFIKESEVHTRNLTPCVNQMSSVGKSDTVSGQIIQL